MSERDKKLLVYLGALIILAAAYFLVGKPYLDKMDSLSNEKAALTAALSEKQLAFSRQGEFQQGIEKGKADIQNIIDKFPEDNSDEKSIMFVANAEKDVSMWISNIQFAEDTEGLVSGEESASDREQEALEANIAANDDEYEAPVDNPAGENTQQGIGISNLIGRTTQLGLTYTTDYAGFKKLLAYVRDYEDRMVISDLNVTYNPEIGVVTGNMILSQYAILGPDRELPEVETGVSKLGLSNVFVANSSGSYASNFSSDDVSQSSSQVLESEDYYVKLSAVTGNTHGITIGRADDVMESTSIVSDANTNEDVFFEFTGSEGSYKVTYTIGEQSFIDGFGKDSGSRIRLRVVSTRRTSESDQVAMKLHVTNETDLPIVISVEGDDKDNPRVNFAEKNGAVVVND